MEYTNRLRQIGAEEVDDVLPDDYMNIDAGVIDHGDIDMTDAGASNDQSTGTEISHLINAPEEAQKNQEAIARVLDLIQGSTTLPAGLKDSAMSAVNLLSDEYARAQLN